MRAHIPRAALAALTAALCASPAIASADWFKGNTHCHTEFSPDSDTPVEDLMAWYKGQGYDFIVLTDHNAYQPGNFFAGLEAFDEQAGAVVPLIDEGFIIIPGEELTHSAHHVNGLDLPRRLDVGATIAQSFERVWAADGLPQLNHPEWSFLTGADVIAELAELDGAMFMEVYNSHPVVVERSGVSSADIWDAVLSTGRTLWGVASDDAHTMPGGHTPPGGGYIMVDAEGLDTASILDAMARGRFYASSGATLADFRWTASVYEVDAPGATEIVFIGRHGQVLERADADFASYRFRGDELYVRAEVRSPAGWAWTQPVFIGTLPENLPPTASFTADPTSGEAPLRVRFDARASSDPDGELIGYRWDFGDGEFGRGDSIVHRFEGPGSRTVTLTVIDDAGDVDRSSVTLEIRAPINTPGNNDNNDNNGGIIITPGNNDPNNNANNGTPDANNAANNNEPANNGQDGGMKIRRPPG